MAPLAQLLASHRGVLEPLQTARSVKGQIEELKKAIAAHSTIPVILIGFSWGAWLSLMVAAQNPALIRKLILIGCAPLNEDLAARVPETRLHRLGEEEREDFIAQLLILADPDTPEKDHAMARLGALADITDAFDPLPEANPLMEYRGDIFQQVWTEAAELRRSGKLLRLTKRIQCPVVAIHGDYDPHPAAAVAKNLAGVVKDFRFILLDNCGHKPWIERQARDAFLRVLKDELQTGSREKTKYAGR
jgi:pimeloyl-ACP methyl ester carboxylesterase